MRRKTYTAPILELPEEWGGFDSNGKVVVTEEGGEFEFWIDCYGELDDGIEPLYAEFLQGRHKKDDPKTLDEVRDLLVEKGVIAKDTVLTEHSELVVH